MFLNAIEYVKSRPGLVARRRLFTFYLNKIKAQLKVLGEQHNTHTQPVKFVSDFETTQNYNNNRAKLFRYIYINKE